MLQCSPAAVARKLHCSIVVHPARYVHLPKFLLSTAAHSSPQEATEPDQTELVALPEAQQATVVPGSPKANIQGQEAGHPQCKENGLSSSKKPSVSKITVGKISSTHSKQKIGNSSSHAAIRKPGSVRVKSKDGKAPGVDDDCL